MNSRQGPDSLLVVEDEPEIRSLIADWLEEAGYRVATAPDGLSALREFYQQHPDLVLLDVMMPKMDGWELCRRIREVSDVPIVFLSAREQESDRVRGLTLGADDYITKPFSPRELVARVRAVLRRSEGAATAGGMIQSDALRIDLERRSVRRAETPIELTATEFDLLAVLAREPGRPFTRTQLLEQVYDVSFAGYERTIDAHIKNLRRKIEPDPQNPQYILTIYGVGYKFKEPV
jgi:two-component system alkaline phosphatase synthesis response regulator PhoP